MVFLSSASSVLGSKHAPPRPSFSSKKLVGNLGVVDCGYNPSTSETKTGHSLFEASVMVCLLHHQPAREIEGHWPKKPKSKQTKQAKMEIV